MSSKGGRAPDPSSQPATTSHHRISKHSLPSPQREAIEDLRARRKRRAQEKQEISGSQPSSNRDRRRHRSKTPEKAPIENVAAPVKKVGGQANEIFVIDRRGDPLILRYGINDRSRVPSYRRYGNGKALGSSESLVIAHEGTRDVFFSRTYRDSGSIFREKNSTLLRASQSKSRRIIPEARIETDQASGTGDDYVALTTVRKRKRSGDDALSESDDDGPSYRSIHGKAKRHEFSDSDIDYSSDPSTPGQLTLPERLNPAKTRSIELTRLVKDHPDDIDSWIELVDLQDSIFNSENAGPPTSKDEIKALAEMKISILESALSHATSPRDREKLLVRLMSQASKIWGSTQLASRWQEIRKENNDSFELYISRLGFEMTNMSTFTLERLKSGFTERMQILTRQLTEAPSTTLCEQIIYVFLRATCFLRDSGFAEVAIAAWQAQLELTFARPKLLIDSDRDTLMTSFAEFWESEVPRIGEDGARGWRHFDEASGTAIAPEPMAGQPTQPPKTRDAYKAWAAMEQQHATSSQAPARTLDEGSEDDPFRVVMFADIDYLLFIIPSSASALATSQLLVDCYLLFAQLRPAFEHDRSRSTRNDPFICSDGDTKAVHQATYSFRGEQDATGKTSVLSRDSSRISKSPDTLFAGSSWFSYFPASLCDADDAGCSRVAMTIRQLVFSFGVETLADYSLALDCFRQPSNAKKAAKGLLKLYPSNMALYNAYALAEWANGKHDVAHKVLMSATAQTSNSRAESSIPLWQSWAWIELETGSTDRAVARLCASAEEQSEHASSEEVSVTPSQLLKARQRLQTSRDYQLSSGNLSTAALFAQSCTLLEYLTAQEGSETTSTTQGNISAAMATTSSFSTELASRGLATAPAHERLLQFAARLLFFHASHGPYRPIYLREQFLRLISFFPQNTMFLSLFTWAETGLRIDDPVSQILRTTVLSEAHDCVNSRFFALRHEMRVGNVYSEQAAFEDAVESAACKGNAALWISYIRYCFSKKELRPRAKEVFYRAVRVCPWSKTLMMEAFTTIIKDMETSELKAVYNNMQAKGLRVHIEMDEFVEKWQQAEKDARHR